MSAEPLVTSLPTGTLARYRTLGAALRTRGEHDAADAILELTELLRSVDAALVSEHESALRMAKVVREKVPRWISVEERMPEESTDVLAFVSEGERGDSAVVASRTGAEWATWGAHPEDDGLCYESLGRVTYVVARVTHWMPIPAPPEEKT